MILLINPPVYKPCEPPAGIARLCGALKAHGEAVTVYDASIDAILALLHTDHAANDTWSRRALRHVQQYCNELRSPSIYHSFSRYRQAVAALARVLALAGAGTGALSLVNYQESQLSPLRSDHLIMSAAHYEHNLFSPIFAPRLLDLVETEQPSMVGISLNYLSQALSAFAVIGCLRRHFPTLTIVIGGGLVTSWLSRPDWKNPFAGLVDHLVAGPGETKLLALSGRKARDAVTCPDYSLLPGNDYLSPGFILPYSASSGCYWNRCTFCPENAEQTPYRPLSTERVFSELDVLIRSTQPRLVHFLDNAISPALLKKLVTHPPGVDWYGFARVERELTDVDFCRALRRSGCRMLKLGLESGDQRVLDEMDKGINLAQVSSALSALHTAGIATYVYLLFGTPAEDHASARRTLAFAARHHRAITFLNLAVFNLPVASCEASTLQTNDFYEGDLSLYSDFIHPKGWHRSQVRRFLGQEFKRHPDVAAILRRDPPFFTSNHAPFFC